MTKYLLITIFNSDVYTKKRVLYKTYEEAKAKYNEILKQYYTEQELSPDANGECYLRRECEHTFPAREDYLDDWYDDLKNVYLCIMTVEEAEN